MVRVSDLEESLDFYCNKLGLVETRRVDNEKGRYTLVSRRRRDVEKARHAAPLVELTCNWDEHEYEGGRHFGHLAYPVDDIYETCRKLMDAGVTINRPPRDGNMAFIRSPDNISIELLQQRPEAAAGAVGVDAEYGGVVRAWGVGEWRMANGNGEWGVGSRVG